MQKFDLRVLVEQNRSAEGCSKLKRSVDMTSSGKNGLNIRTNASPKWDRTRCPLDFKKVKTRYEVMSQYPSLDTVEKIL